MKHQCNKTIEKILNITKRVRISEFYRRKAAFKTEDLMHANDKVF